MLVRGDLGREGGLCGGKGGSMHLADFDKGIIGSNAIVGAQLPIALGAGLAAQYQAGQGPERRFHRRRVHEYRCFPRELEHGGRLATCR